MEASLGGKGLGTGFVVDLSGGAELVDVEALVDGGDLAGAGRSAGVGGDSHAALPRAVFGCFGTRYRERRARAWGLR